MDHLRIMGFLLLLFTTLFALQCAEARVLEHHFRNTVLSQHNSAHLDAVAVASSTTGGHVTNHKESESNPGSNSENSTQYVNTIAVELLQKGATPGVASGSKAPEGIKEVAPIEDNAAILHEMLNSDSSHGVHGHMISVNDGIGGNILSSSGNSPGVGHWRISKTAYSSSPAGRTTPNNLLSFGPSPGVGNVHTSGIAGTQPELGTFNKLPSGSSPGVGHKVINGNTDQVAQELDLKKSAMIMNKLPSGPSSGVGHSATDGRNMMEKMSIESESKKKTAFTTLETGSKRKSEFMNILPSGPSSGVGHSATDGRNMMEKMSNIESESKKKTELTVETDSKRKSAMMMNILPSGPSPGVGHSATNGRNTMEINSNQKDEEGMGIQTSNELPLGSSPGVGHSFTNAHQPQKLQRTSENRKGSDDSPILEKLPGGPSPGDINSSINKLKASGSQKQKVEQSLEGLNRKIGCDTDQSQFFGGPSFYGTPTPPMFGIAAGRYNEYPTSKF